MKVGIVGLGRMGSNIARNAIAAGHDVVGFNRSPAVTKTLEREGLHPALSLAELVGALPQPRVVLIYVPHGEPTDEVCRDLLGLLARDDIVVDGGNSHWEDSIRRHGMFSEAGIRFLDVGTSGGIDGARTGACFMAGGARDAFDVVAPLLRDLAVNDAAVVHAGEPGAGHFTKLVHNAIEFGMIQSIAEGVELLQRSGFGVDPVALLENWNNGSVIRSWLIELMGKALAEEKAPDELSTYVEDTDEVKWVITWALDRDIPIPLITASQQQLMAYRDLEWPQAKAVALLRNQFGGHPVHRVDGTAPVRR